MEENSFSVSSHHVVLFPFMAKGHTIPIVHLAHFLLSRCGIAVILFTTPANRPFVAKSLSGTAASIIDIPFPQNIPEIPPGVESTDKLPSLSLHVPFCRATKLMQPYFESKLETLLPISFMVWDGLLWWTLESASKFGFPRLVFYGMSAYTSCVSQVVMEYRLLHGPESDNELITVSPFPWIKVTKSDFEQVFQSLIPRVLNLSYWWTKTYWCRRVLDWLSTASTSLSPRLAITGTVMIGSSYGASGLCAWQSHQNQEMSPTINPLGYSGWIES